MPREHINGGNAEESRKSLPTDGQCGFLADTAPDAPDEVLIRKYRHNELDEVLSEFVQSMIDQFRDWHELNARIEDENNEHR